MNSEDETINRLRDWCSETFPYVCTGEKRTREDGAAECECGAVLLARRRATESGEGER